MPRHYYTMLTLCAFLCANISRTSRLPISENLYHSILRIPKSDRLRQPIIRHMKHIAARKYVFSNFSFERLRSLLATVGPLVPTPGARGPRFIEPSEPPVSTPLGRAPGQRGVKPHQLKLKAFAEVRNKAQIYPF